MPVPMIRADYEVLEKIARIFQQQGQSTGQTLRRIRQSMDTLQSGDWIGQGAGKFYGEMDSSVLPSVDRLAKSMAAAARVTQRISGVMKQAEEEASRVLRGDGRGGGGGVSPGPGGDGGGAGDAGEGGGGGGAGSDAEEVVDRTLSDFSSDVRDIVNQSPTLQGQLEDLEEDGWTIEEGPAGGGSYADHDNSTLVIAGGRSAEDTTRSIAHEIGHAEYGDEPYHAPTDDMTRQEYVDANVDEQLRSEGNAQLNGATVRNEVTGNGGPDIGISGTQTEDYQSIYEQYQEGDISRDEAIDQMADLMGNETTSTTGENYRDYYGQTYEDYWDEHVAPNRED